MIRLTGMTRFRSNWRGKLILQVQVEARTSRGDCLNSMMSIDLVWRDAKTEDLAELHALHYTNITVLLPEVNAKGEIAPSGRKTH